MVCFIVYNNFQMVYGSYIGFNRQFSYRRSYVTTSAPVAPKRDGARRRPSSVTRGSSLSRYGSALPGTDPGDGRPWSAIRGTLFFPSYGYPIYGDGTRRRLLAGRKLYQGTQVSRRTGQPLPGTEQGTLLY